MANYVENNDGSIDILLRIEKDSDPNRGCSECCFIKVCKSKQFRKSHCFIDSIFGLKEKSYNSHITMIV